MLCEILLSAERTKSALGLVTLKENENIVNEPFICPLQAERERLVVFIYFYFFSACRVVGLISTRRVQRRHGSERHDCLGG